jgi:hypothetical protein
VKAADAVILALALLLGGTACATDDGNGGDTTAESGETGSDTFGSGPNQTSATTGGGSEKGEVAMDTEVDLGLPFGEEPAPEEARRGPLGVFVDYERIPVLARVAVTNKGSGTVDDVVLVDAVRTAQSDFTEEGDAPSLTVAPSQITAQISAGRCRRSTSGATVRFTCDVGSLRPGQTVTLTVRFPVAVKVFQDVGVTATLP